MGLTPFSPSVLRKPVWLIVELLQYDISSACSWADHSVSISCHPKSVMLPVAVPEMLVGACPYSRLEELWLGLELEWGIVVPDVVHLIAKILCSILAIKHDANEQSRWINRWLDSSARGLLGWDLVVETATLVCSATGDRRRCGVVLPGLWHPSRRISAPRELFLKQKGLFPGCPIFERLSLPLLVSDATLVGLSGVTERPPRHWTYLENIVLLCVYSICLEFGSVVTSVRAISLTLSHLFYLYRTQQFRCLSEELALVHFVNDEPDAGLPREQRTSPFSWHAMFAVILSRTRRCWCRRAEHPILCRMHPWLTSELWHSCVCMDCLKILAHHFISDRTS